MPLGFAQVFLSCVNVLKSEEAEPTDMQLECLPVWQCQAGMAADVDSGWELPRVRIFHMVKVSHRQ
jgi:hypothetical protein